MGYFDKFKNSGVSFMDGRDKQELSMLVGEKVHVEDFGFLNGSDGEYAVFCVREWPNSFFFGNSIITETFKQIEADGMKDALSAVGMVCKERTSKNGRLYTAVEFVDEIPF